MTIKSVLTQGKQILRQAGLETPSLDAELLLSSLLHKDRAHLILDTDNQLSPEDYQHYITQLTRRLEGECTAYITGHKEFRYLDLHINENVLVPRPETESLVEAALECIDSLTRNKTVEQKEAALLQEKPVSPPISVLDLCTGSGAIALSLLHERASIEIYASDISEPALAVAKKNYLSFTASLESVSGEGGPHPPFPPPSAGMQPPPPFTGRKPPVFIHSDLFEHINRRFNIIVSNPPYIPSKDIVRLSKEVQHEPLIALDGGTDGLDLIRKIIKGAWEHLFKNGYLLLESSPEQIPDITLLLQHSGCHDIAVYKDLAGNQRVIRAMTPAFTFRQGK